MIVFAVLLVLSVFLNVGLAHALSMSNTNNKIISDQRDSFKRLYESANQAVPVPRCACGHGYGNHKDGGRCMDYAYNDGGFLAFVLRADRCTCYTYTGPTPVPEYYHPGELT